MLTLLNDVSFSAPELYTSSYAWMYPFFSQLLQAVETLNSIELVHVQTM